MALGYAPGREGLRRLSTMLRQPLPRGFTWDFATLDHCAIGLARFVWPQFRAISPNPTLRSASVEARAFGMRVKHYKEIFGIHIGEYWIYGDHRSAGDITPADVADAIDNYLM